MLKVLTSLLPLLLLTGCYSSTGPAPGDTEAQERFWTKEAVGVRIDALRWELQTACPAADPKEIDEVAGVTIRYGELLGDEYGLSRPPEYHNIGVRLGVKKRGLCFQLADDLYVRLRALKLRTLDLHQAISKEGHLTEEHNCVIVTDKAKPMETGVVLDLWRYAGKARFISVVNDHHTWIERQIPPAPPVVVEDDVQAAANSRTMRQQ